MKQPYIVQGRSTAVPHYLIQDYITGCTEKCTLGDADDARRQRGDFQRQYPRGLWLLLDIIASPDPDTLTNVEPFWWRPGYDALLEKLK